MRCSSSRLGLEAIFATIMALVSLFGGVFAHLIIVHNDGSGGFTS